MKRLKELLDRAGSNVGDDSLFMEVINYQLQTLGVDELTLAEELKTSVPTIRRWSNRETVPHVLIREGVYRALLKGI